MKKILFVLGMVFGLTFSAVAQTEAKTAEAIEKEPLTVVKTIEDGAADAKLDVKDLANLVQLDDATVQAFYQLFQMKYSVTYNSEMSAERKSIMRSEVTAKIRATLNAAQMKQLESNIALFKRLTN